ncbi:MAG: hypothetical protein K6E53_01420 [Lachnospiraceae bacterium]|nr:hypothetical protein [Lachnospiraceae bacterium]
MQTTLTERDKKLLIFLSLFVIVVGIGYWGLRPIYKNIKETDEAIEEAQALKESNELKISQLPVYEKDNEELEKDIVAARQSFYPIMSSDEIDKMFTTMVLDYNLYSYFLRISIDEEELQSEPYQYSNKALGLEAEEEEGPPEELDTYDAQAVDDYAEDQYAIPEFEDEKPQTGIYEARVNMQVGGRVDDMQRLIDDLSNKKDKMLLDSYSWSRKSDVVLNNASGEYEVDNTDRVEFTVSLFMYKE